MLLGLVVGAGLGLIARTLAGDAPWLQWTLTNVTGPIGQIFLRLLFMLVVPMIFSALVMGVADLELRHLGRLGVRALGYTVVISTIAVLIGLVLVNVFRPGEGMSDEVPGEGMSDEVRALARTSVVPKAAVAPGDNSPAGLLVSIVPDNPVKAAANGDYLGLIFFALVFGIALGLTRTPAAQRLKRSSPGCTR
jgi:DAACS family dicarboxylate/amino acid:cation (Na+ or H+) symporter